MVGESQKRYTLDEVLSEKQINVIIKKTLGNGYQWNFLRSEVKPAADGIAGFLGDHLKAALHFEADGENVTVNIFIKRLPANNKPKAEYIKEHSYYKRERLMFSLLEEFHEFDSNPWSPTAFIYTDELLVLPDLTVQGYKPRHYLDNLDMQHVLLTVTSIARFHAEFANFVTNKSTNSIQYNILNDYGEILSEPTFYESPWITSAAKLTAGFLDTFSSKYRNISGLEHALYDLFIEACHSLRDYEDTLNVLIHKDLWINNIMFKYESGVPVNAILIDFQCLRYSPPAFDLMIFLYLTTSRNFREKYEADIMNHYYKIFSESINDGTKERLRLLGYDKQAWLDWCERGRMFGMLEAITIFPFVLMDPKTAQKTFDDPETYEKYLKEDRSEPVIGHAKKCLAYKEKQLEVSEEFIERYVLTDKRRLVSEG